MKTEMNGSVFRVAGGGRRNTDSRQTKAFQAPACVAGSVLEMFQPAVLVPTVGREEHGCVTRQRKEKREGAMN
jgi:hypothetical protein